MLKQMMKNSLMVLALLGFLSGCAIVQGKSSPSQYSNDAAATAAIKAKLIQSDITSASNIHVETQNGVVQMSGFVSNKTQSAEAQRLASSVSGVKSVINDLVISPPASYKKNRNA
jgi:hyperosmotically inducible periplasmic protein